MDTITRTAFYLSDGSFLVIRESSKTSEGIPIIVRDLFYDVNGAQGPNAYGKDVFIFQFTDDGNGVQFACKDNIYSQIENNCSTKSAALGNGGCCGEKIRRDGWVMKDDYPW